MATGRGGHRAGAGRKRRQPQSTLPPSNEVSRFAKAIFQGLALHALDIAPGSAASDDELVELAIADLVRNECRRGRGNEVLRLAGNVVATLQSHQAVAADEGPSLVQAMSSLPGLDAAPIPSAPKGEIVGTGRSVRELASVLKDAGQSVVPPRQSELFDATPIIGVLN